MVVVDGAQGFIARDGRVRHMSGAEQLRCNICGLKLPSSEAKVHSTLPSHLTLKQKLEHELEAVKEGRYANDNSVIVQWTNSV